MTITQAMLDNYESRTTTLSLALHRAAMPYLRADWEGSKRIMMGNLARSRMRRRSAMAKSWLNDWERAIEEGPDAVERIALERGERADDRRQMTPMAGVLPSEEQRRIVRETPRAAY